MVQATSSATNWPSSQQDSAALPQKISPLVNAETPPKKPYRGEFGELLGPQLNFDVLYLIFFACHPRDLLSFARTCKSVRRILMSKSSAFIWKAARSQVEGMPDCSADLSEPAYAYLVFYPYCHGCGNHTKQIFWNMRRRYCKKCKNERLFPWRTWDTIKLVGEDIQKDFGLWVEKDQIDPWVEEYKHASDEKGFLARKKQHYFAVADHALECSLWQEQMASKRKDELEACLRKRNKSILDRLMQLGYEREMYYFGRDLFCDSNRKKTLKKAPKLLTDREWNRILPWWLKVMNRYRQVRLDRLYRPRWETLKSEFDRYVARRSPDTPSCDLLPDVAEVACYPPFRDILNTPEGTALGENPFAPAFAQLPALVNDWKKQLDTEFASIVKIPPDLISGDTSCGSSVASKDKKRTEGLQTDPDKLRLACAMFKCGYDILAYPEIFSVATNHHLRKWQFDELTKSLYDRFCISFLYEAPYIIHACGLDPSVATPDDMDRRDARLRCLFCNRRNPLIMNWKDAMVHARGHHYLDRQSEPLSMSPRWQLVSGEHIDMIRAAESIEWEHPSRKRVRCLLCLSHVGDARWEDQIDFHLHYSHDVKKEDVQRGVHFACIDFRNGPSTVVEMEVTFRRVK